MPQAAFPSPLSIPTNVKVSIYWEPVLGAFEIREEIAPERQSPATTKMGSVTRATVINAEFVVNGNIFSRRGYLENLLPKVEHPRIKPGFRIPYAYITGILVPNDWAPPSEISTIHFDYSRHDHDPPLPGCFREDRQGLIIMNASYVHMSVRPSQKGASFVEPKVIAGGHLVYA